MNTQTFQIFSLRGMDERWITDPQNALYIQDMTWNSNDSWSTSGGWYPYFRFSPYYGAGEQRYYQSPGYTIVDGEKVYETDDRWYQTDKYIYPHVRSIHWFAQHNGARQFLVYEQQTWDENSNNIDENRLELRYFDGSRSYWKKSSESGNNEPSRLLVGFKRNNDNCFGNSDIGRDLKAFNNRYDSGLSVPTQYQAWGDRLYIVNGYQEPLVFNGEYAEAAGFVSKPAQPRAQDGDWYDTNTFPTGIGFKDWGGFDLLLANTEKWRGEQDFLHGRFMDYPYHGMGPGSFAKYKTGKYRAVHLSALGDYFTEAGEADGTTIATSDMVDFPDNDVLKFSLRFNKQMNRRKVGWMYKVTYVNERGQESEPSDASNLAKSLNGTGTPNHHGACFISVDIPRGPSECVARRVYRTRNLFNSKGKSVSRGKQERFYFLKEIQDNMSSKFVDSNPDSALGSLLATRKVGSFPSNPRFIASFKNTMFVAGNTDNFIRFSVPNFPEVFPKKNKINIGDGDGGPITGVRATKNALVVFKSRGIYLIKGNARKGFYAETLTRDVGMWAPDSVAEIQGMGLAFLSDKGVYILEGALENTGTITQVVKISTEIPNQFELINTSGSIRAVGLINEADNEYWLAVPINGSKVNNIVFVYHYLVGSWSVRENFPISCGTTSKDHRGYLFFGIEYDNNVAVTGIDTSPDAPSEERLMTRDDLEHLNKVGIGVYSKGYSKKGAIWDVDPIYKTHDHSFGAVFNSIHPAHVCAYAVGYGDNKMSLNYRVNRSVFDVRDHEQATGQQDPNERYPVYGKAVWGEDYWSEYRPTVLRYDVSTTHKGPVREFGVTFAKSENAESGTKIEIIGYDIEAKVGEQRKIKPLNEALKPDRR